MSNFNIVVLMGTLTRDPEQRFTPKGTCVCKFSIAVNRTWRNEAGEKKEEVTFVELDSFGKTAENIGQYFHKGSRIHIQGRLRLDQWDDKQTGQKRQKLGVVVESFTFVDKRGEGPGSERSERPATSRPARTPAAAPPPAEGEPEAPPDDDSDVPFLSNNSGSWLGKLIGTVNTILSPAWKS